MDIALLHQAKPAAPASRGLELHLRRVLDRQHMPARRRPPRRLGPPRDDLFDRDPAAPKHAVEPQHAATRARQAPNANRRARHHAGDEIRPRPIKANVPKPAEAAIHSDPPNVRTTIYRFMNPHPGKAKSLIRLANIRACPSPLRGEGRGGGSGRPRLNGPVSWNRCTRPPSLGTLNRVALR